VQLVRVECTVSSAVNTYSWFQAGQVMTNQKYDEAYELSQDLSMAESFDGRDKVFFLILRFSRVSGADAFFSFSLTFVPRNRQKESASCVMINTTRRLTLVCPSIRVQWLSLKMKQNQYQMFQMMQSY
jgi:hypothetical protein